MTSSEQMTASQQKHEQNEHHQLVDLGTKTQDADSLHSPLRPMSDKRSLRESLERILNSYRFHVAIIVMVVLDCFLVFGEMIMDLKVFQSHNYNCNESRHLIGTEAQNESHQMWKTVEEVFHYSSIGLLGLFVCEVFLKIVVFGSKFFCKFEELIDAIIIIVSFVLDIVFINNDLFKFVGVLIFLRLWRVVRIVHAIITAVMTPMEHRIETEEKKRAQAERKLKESQQENEVLRCKLLALQEQIAHNTLPSIGKPSTALQRR